MISLRLFFASACFVAAVAASAAIAQSPSPSSPPRGAVAGVSSDYLAARWNPIHFSPRIERATDAQCLACHREVLDDRPLTASPVGLLAADAIAWYQTANTYAGPQETFHRRHLVMPLAKQLMAMKCNTCHQGHDPREQALVPAGASDSFTLRKTVNPKTCQMCHGPFPYPSMGLPSDWLTSGPTVGNNCLACHAAIRTVRHRVNYLKADAIEKAAAQNSEVCHGCHGGRAWYRVAYPYARNPWPDMPADTPAWAKGRPSRSEARFLQGVAAPSR